MPQADPVEELSNDIFQSRENSKQRGERGYNLHIVNHVDGSIGKARCIPVAPRGARTEIRVQIKKNTRKTYEGQAGMK